MSKSKRPTQPLYLTACQWIADNDEPTCKDALEMRGLISVLLVADIFGRTVADVAAKVIELRAVAAPPDDPWTLPKYPGDTVREYRLLRADEPGSVVIQQWAVDRFFVGAFLPGYVIAVPGDTPKTNANYGEMVTGSRDDAAAIYAAYVKRALGAGWGTRP